MPNVVYISEQYPNLVEFPADWNLVRFPHETVPPLEAARASDFVLLVGQFTNATWAEQLAGLLGHVIPDGTVLIVAFPHQVAGALDALLARLGIRHVLGAMTPQNVDTVHPAFTEYFALFGQSATKFEADQAAEVLGQIELSDGEFVPAAVSVSRGRGAIYAVPFYFAGAQDQFAPRGTGTALENLVIEALNVVLDGKDYRAEDRPDVRAEDFWIVGPKGDAALAEVKGVNTNVRREDVNQVDNHRESAGQPPEFPGLLVFNIFRGHDTLEQRQLPVPDQAVTRAANSNVLILRTQDLYNLASRKLAGDDAGQELLDALQAGGGWLEVNSDSVTLRTPS